MEAWQQLSVGIVGALIGGALSFFGALWAANKTAKSAYGLARKERLQREHLARRAAVSGLSSEIRDNLKLSAKSSSKSDTLVPFLTDMWQAYKGSIEFLDSDIQESVRAGYAAAFLANALEKTVLQLEYTQTYFLEDDYRERVKEMASEFEKADRGLSNWLESTPGHFDA